MSDITTPDWNRTKLGDFVSLQRGYDLPKSARQEGRVPVIGSGGQTGHHNVAMVHGPGITIGRAANLGVPTLVSEDFWPLNTTLFVTDFNGNDVKFVYYLLKTMNLAGYDSGSVQPMLNRNYIRNVPLIVPFPAEQRAISALLGTLDDKIGANERIADTANELAKEHYWSETGRWMSAGEISLGEAACWYSGGTPSTTEPSYWNGDIPWISAVSMKSTWIDSSDRMITGLGAENGTRMVPARTILFVVRGMSLKSEFRAGITQREVAFGQDCKALVVNENIDPFYLFYSILCRTEQILGLVDEAGHGTGRLATDRLAALKIALPGDTEQRRLVDKLQPLAELAAARQRESRALAELRDTLLPKLISGELRIRDAERHVADVV